MKNSIKLMAAGAVAGAVNGLFGAGGGMVLVPLLTAFSVVSEEDVFPTSVSIILPICFISLLAGTTLSNLPWMQAFPYLIGGIVSGVIVGLTGNIIPVKWLHRILGVLILYGGIQYLW